MSTAACPRLPASYLEPVDAGLFSGAQEFVRIDGLDQMRDGVEGRIGIGFFEHDGLVVCRYTIAIPEVFQTAWDVECRGLIFDAATGDLLSRPLHKFFNLGERQGVRDLDLAAGWLLETKLDGSMVASFLRKGEIVFHTRGGVSAQARAARSHASDNILGLARAAAEIGATPIFEWCAPGNRVVIAYDKPELTLLALRDITTGRYLDAAPLAERFGVPRPAVLAGAIRSGEEFEAACREILVRTDIEGAVLVGPEGHRLKIKAADYLARHKILANLGNERYAYQAWIDDVVDDTAAALGGARGRQLVGFTSSIEVRIARIEETIDAIIAPLSDLDRKEAAARINARLEGAWKTLAFARMGGGNIRSSIREILLRRVSSPEKRNALKRELGLPDWEACLLDLD